MTKEELLKIIEELNTQRQNLLLQANLKIGEVNGRIAAYQEMLDRLEEEKQ